ncbi:unnamed protein product [Diamesa hyperborea]
MNSFVILVLLLSCCTFLGETDGRMIFPGDPILSQQRIKVKTEERSEIVNENVDKMHTGRGGGRMIYPNDPAYKAYLEEKRLSTSEQAKPIINRFAKMINQEVTDHVNLSNETSSG